MKKIIVLVACAMVVGGAGCVSSSKIHNEASVGQQLKDLEESRKAGIINQKEYERLRKALIKKHD